MEPVNRERVLIRCLREIASERDLDMTLCSHDWIVQLRSSTQRRFVFGYNFDLNSSAAAMIANDKSAAADVLAEAGVRAVPHWLFLHPRMTGYVGSDGNWSRAMELAEQHGYDLVIKPNRGTGGAGVLRVTHQRELEAAFQQLHQSQHGICAAPHVEIEDEFRAIVLDQAILLVYSKVLPRVLGDGQSTVLELVAEARDRAELTLHEAGSIALQANPQVLSSVPDHGVEITLLWQRNLGRGATPAPIDDASLRRDIEDLAVAAARAIGIRCAAVDLVRSHRRGLEVLEVNSGIMLESYDRRAWQGAPSPASIYDRIVAAMFSLEG